MNSIRFFCASDNELLAEALRERLGALPDMKWVGWSPNAVDLTEQLRRSGANVLLLDIDMPLVDPISALAAVTTALPGVHTLVLTGFIDRRRFDRAMAAGASGYLMKLARGDVIVDGVRSVHAGRVVSDLAPRLVARREMLFGPLSGVGAWSMWQ